MLSRLSWNKIRSDICSVNPIDLHFSPYTEEQTINILDLDCKTDEYRDIYQYLTRLIYKIFSSVTKDLNELRRMVEILFPRIIQPVIDGQS